MSIQSEENYKTAHETATRNAQRILDWLKANKNPKGKIWAEVEEMVYTGYQLKEITDRLYQEGEYAKG